MQNDTAEPQGGLVAAFLNQYNLILFGGSALFSLASASWMPFAVGVASELAWLSMAPLFPAFKRWPRLGGGAVAHAPVETAPSSAILDPSLDGEHADRVARLEGTLAEIQELGFAAQRSTPYPELQAALNELGVLRSAFVRLCVLRQRLSRYLSQSSPEELEQAVAQLSEDAAKERDLGIRVSYRQAITLAQRRLEQYGRMSAMHRAAELRAGIVESSASHVKERGVLFASPAELTAEIRNLLSQVNTIAALERDATESPAGARPAMAHGTPAVAGDG